MNLSLEFLFVISASLLLLSILMSKLSVRFGVPVLLLFILIGILLGSEGLGGIHFDDPQLTQSIGVIALVFILFSGGLDTRWHSIRPVLKEGLLLATLGVAMTAFAVAWFAQSFLGFSWEAGMLLGATMASTDAAAVFAVLRGKNVNLKGQLKPVLELESGSNDPMAIFLTLSMIQLLQNGNMSLVDLLLGFVWQMALGLGIGWFLSQLILRGINRLRLEYDGLYPVLSIGFVLLTYGLTSLLGGNGFLAVYVAGLVLARGDFIHKNSIQQFHDGLAWLMQILMFLTLGLQVFPSRLLNIAGVGILVAVFLIFFARPLSVFVALLPTNFTWREKLYISWVGLRGAAPIILATFSQLANIALPLPIFDLVFFVVLVSILLQGTSLVPMARLLNLYNPEAEKASLLKYISSGHSINENLLELSIPAGAKVLNKTVIDLNLPDGVLLVLLNRNGEIIVPKGSTSFESNDDILLLAPKGQREALNALFTEREGL